MNSKLILYALHSIKQRKVKSIVLSLVLILLTFILYSLFSVQSSLKNILQTNTNNMPQITLQKLQGGRIVFVEKSIADKILEIKGVSNVSTRVWGYYFYNMAQKNLIIANYDLYKKAGHKSFEKIINKELDNENEGLIIGEGVKNMLLKYRGDANSMTFVNNSLQSFNIKVIDTFKDSNPIFTNDLVLTPTSFSHKILEIPKNKATDIVVYVPNKQEVSTVVKKIREKYPNLRIITKEALKSGYEQVLSYKSGLSLSIFIVVLCSFFILVFEKASGLSEYEKQEIATLKAIGWQSRDILWVKTIENIIISINSFLIGLALALTFVFVFQAPIFRDIFLGYNSFSTSFILPFSLDISIIAITFLLTVGIYLAAVLLPTYKCAVIDADEGLR